ncbi:hypothetical protein ASPSYDRAFT_573757 [Aspergillus sydowii CBS 593.65]|uniref:Uncharacterized protein n=1 Tax=Aspergillus sydowii CBS 593.65 TaxID=1036612 RepID=A0A1L9SZK0_9EURO|nr:uncharacterized protein ASPSYDRAFT_573757 [Aspergillus sydowii CBS 593.65]OJJ52585.1 hypothetical protein ASPSYDRAFT_573757 [Aspergillus sydowii CBS 593.65]
MTSQQSYRPSSLNLRRFTVPCIELFCRRKVHHASSFAPFIYLFSFFSLFLFFECILSSLEQIQKPAPGCPANGLGLQM